LPAAAFETPAKFAISDNLAFSIFLFPDFVFFDLPVYHIL